MSLRGYSPAFAGINQEKSMNIVSGDPRKMGQISRKYGTDVGDNPFSKKYNPEYHNQWLEGWHDGDVENVEASPEHWDSISGEPEGPFNTGAQS